MIAVLGDSVPSPEAMGIVVFPFRIVAIVLSGAFLAIIILRKSIRLVNPIAVLGMGVFVWWAIASIFWTPDIVGASAVIGTVIAASGVLLFAIQGEGGRDLRPLVEGWGLVIILVGVLALVEAGTGFNVFSAYGAATMGKAKPWTPVGPVGGPNGLASVFVSCACLVSLDRYSRLSGSKVVVLLLVLSTLVVLLTASLLGIAAMGVVWLGFFLSGRGNSAWRHQRQSNLLYKVFLPTIMVSIAVVLVGVFSFGTLSGGHLSEKLDARIGALIRGDPMSSKSIYLRSQLSLAALEMGVETFGVGVGAGGFGEVRPSTNHGENVQIDTVHNIVARIWAEFGVVGIVSFLMIGLPTMRLIARRSGRGQAVALCAAAILGWMATSSALLSSSFWLFVITLLVYPVWSTTYCTVSENKRPSKALLRKTFSDR